MMNAMTMFSASPTMMLLHCIACCLMLVGILFFVSWAFKTLTPKQLLSWGLGLFIAGCAICLLAMAPLGSEDHMHMEGMDHSMHDMEGMGDGSAMDHDDMTMGDMTAMLEGKSGDAFDEAFLRMMIPHHQGAIDMVENVEASAKHAELKQLARDIAAAQQREIDMMNGWLQAWGYND